MASCSGWSRLPATAGIVPSFMGPLESAGRSLVNQIGKYPLKERAWSWASEGALKLGQQRRDRRASRGSPASQRCQRDRVKVGRLCLDGRESWKTRGRLHGRSDRLAPEPALHPLGYMELWTDFELMRQTFRLYYQWLCFVLCFYFFLVIGLTAIINNVVDNTYGTLWVELHPPQNTHDEVLTPVFQVVAFTWRQDLYPSNQLK